MWYAIQTYTGKEDETVTCINNCVDRSLFTRCFTPLYEDVWRKENKGHICIRKMFGGYVFIETNDPLKVYMALKAFPQMSVMLYGWDEGFKSFLPVNEEEREFLDSILKEGLMRVSYVHMGNNKRLDKVIGPLSRYADNISKVDMPHRRAFAKIQLLGETRSIKFGLWTDKDERIDWIEEAKKDPGKYRVAAVNNMSPKKDGRAKCGLKAGDRVICTRGIYGDTPLEIAEVREKKGTVVLKVPMFGNVTKVEMDIEDTKPILPR